MNSSIKLILEQKIRLVGFFIHFIYSYSLSLSIKNFFDIIYTGWLQHNFRYIGKLSVIMRPIFIYGGKNIYISENVNIGNNCILTVESDENNCGNIRIGKNTIIGAYSHITSYNQILIGYNVLTGPMLLITDNSHGQFCMEDLKRSPTERSLYSSGKVVIGENVWIGENVSILSGVTIGEGCVIGANSVVTKNIPPYSLCVGAPARIIKSLC